MAAITLFSRASGKAHWSPVVEGTDDIIADSLITSGTTTADVFNDANTTQVNIGGSALTTANLATGAAVTTVNIGTGMGAGDTLTLGGTGSAMTIDSNLTINGTTTTVSSTNLAVSDELIILADGAATGNEAGVAFERGATGDDALLLWNEANTRFELGLFDTSAGTTPPTGALTALSDLRINDMSLDGTAITFDGAGTVTATGATLSLDGTGIETSATSITADAGLSIVTTTTGAASLDSGTTGAVNIGTGGDAKTVTVGSVTGGATTTIRSGTGNLTLDAQGALVLDAENNSTINVAGDLTALLDETQGANTGTAGNAYALTSGIGAAAGASTDGGTGGAVTLTTGAGGAGSATNAGGDGGDLNLVAGDGGVTGGAGAGAAGVINLDSGGTLYPLSASPGPALTTTAQTIIEAINEVDAAVTGGNALSAVLAVGNTTGANDIVVSTGQSIVGADELTLVSTTTGAASLDSGSTGNVNVGTGANSKAVTVGSNTGAATTTIRSGTGALTINSGGTLNVDAANVLIDGTQASNFSLTGAGIDLTLSSAAGRVVVDGGEAAADAVLIDASNAAGGVTISAGTAGINIGNDTAAMTVNIGTGGTGAKTVNIGDESVAASAVTIEAGSAGNITFDALAMTTPITLNQSGNLDLSGFTATSIVGALNEALAAATGADTLAEVLGNGNTTGGTDISVTTGDAIVGAVELTLDSAATGAVNLGTNANAKAITIGNATGATGVTVDSGTGGISIGTSAVARGVLIGTGAAAQTVTVGSTNTTSSLTLQSGTGAMTFTAGGIFDVNATGAVTVDGTSVDLAGTSSSGFTVSGAGVDLSLASAAGQVSIVGGEAGAAAVLIDATNAAGGIDMDAGTGGIAVDSDAGISLDAATASNFTVSGATADLTLGARGATITLNESGETTLDGGFTATSLIGAINENRDSIAAISANSLTEVYTTTGRTIGETVIISGDSAAATQTDADALSTCEGFVGVVLTVGASGTVVTSGTASALFVNASATPAAGDPIYLARATGGAGIAGAGRVTGTAPTGNPNSGIVVYQIGLLKDASTLTVTTVGTDESAAVHIQPMQLIVL
jgi:hypothetical protein